MNEKDTSNNKLAQNNDIDNSLDVIDENDKTNDKNDTMENNLIDDISNNLIENMPDVSEHVIIEHQNKQQEEKDKFIELSEIRDKRGAKFNPDIHILDESTGQPKYTKSGYFSKKRTRNTSSTINSTVSHETINNSQENYKSQKQRTAGANVANTLIMLGVVVGGDEWQPIKNDDLGLDEKANLQGAFADYFEAKDLEDIPAGVALSIAIVGYVAPRFTMPKTQQRSKSLFQKIKAWYVNRKLKKHGLKVESDKKEKKAEEKEV